MLEQASSTSTLLNDALYRISAVSQTAQASAAGVSLDIVIVAVVALSVFVYAVNRGKKRTLASVNALIATLALFLVFPYWEQLIAPETPEKNALMIQAAAFAGIFVILRYITRRMTYGSYPDERGPRWLEAAGLSLAAGGTALAAFYQIFPLQELYQFGPPFDLVFMHSQALFWWLAGMLGVVYFFVRKT